MEFVFPVDTEIQWKFGIEHHGLALEYKFECCESVNSSLSNRTNTKCCYRKKMNEVGLTGVDAISVAAIILKSGLVDDKSQHCAQHDSLLTGQLYL